MVVHAPFHLVHKSIFSCRQPQGRRARMTLLFSSWKVPSAGIVRGGARVNFYDGDKKSDPPTPPPPIQSHVPAPLTQRETWDVTPAIRGTIVHWFSPLTLIFTVFPGVCVLNRTTSDRKSLRHVFYAEDDSLKSCFSYLEQAQKNIFITRYLFF